ncbi:hypothetical protein CKO18_09630 [Rhodoferax fermentans]|uniref:Uncharacterized protein n=1 Tax=Rhodoferax fermentans TaxID=28066 RepID=A0A1T1AXB1_RHOFE|nr:hypothetical protein [Rhodoferax fermentans]OOV08754.1 hypothetical protein RF819_20575 [Rhodoferax fermentans]
MDLVGLLKILFTICLLQSVLFIAIQILSLIDWLMILFFVFCNFRINIEWQRLGLHYLCIT